MLLITLKFSYAHTGCSTSSPSLHLSTHTHPPHPPPPLSSPVQLTLLFCHFASFHPSSSSLSLPAVPSQANNQWQLAHTPLSDSVWEAFYNHRRQTRSQILLWPCQLLLAWSRRHWLSIKWSSQMWSVDLTALAWTQTWTCWSANSWMVPYMLQWTQSASKASKIQLRSEIRITCVRCSGWTDTSGPDRTTRRCLSDIWDDS